VARRQPAGRPVAPRNHGYSVILADEEFFWVNVASFDDLEDLARQDAIAWIADLSPEPQLNTLEAYEDLGMSYVRGPLGYDGDGITLAMVEDRPTRSGLYPMTSVNFDRAGTPGCLGARGREHADDTAFTLTGDTVWSPVRSEGVAPRAVLWSYGFCDVTARQSSYAMPRDARLDHGALAVNNSWGVPADPDHRGEYRKVGHYQDQSVWRHRVVQVRSAGNGRGAAGDIALDYGPPFLDVQTLDNGVPKNAIVVGSYSFATSSLGTTSSVGPTEDLRLKPDIVASHQVNVVAESPMWDATGSYGQTSGAAALVTGAMALLGQGFQERGRIATSVWPSTYRAIVANTAIDMGPEGPDHRFGFGILDTAHAMRTVHDWPLKVQEFVVTRPLFCPDGECVETRFYDLGSAVNELKIVLAWDDKQAAASSSSTLKTDLDLEVCEPDGGRCHFPYRPSPIGFVPTTVSVNAGHTACAPSSLPVGPECRDSKNNIEQVVIRSSGADTLPTGLWEVRVIGGVILRDQPASLVFSHECPVRITSDTTLQSDLTCSYDELAPEVVVIEGDDVTLDCNGFAVIGDPSISTDSGEDYVGIRVLGDNVTLENCTIEGFEVGIAFDEASSGGSVIESVIANVDNGVLVAGHNHTIGGSSWDLANDIALRKDSEGAGVRVLGTDHSISHNNIYGDPAFPAVDAVGVLVESSANVSVFENTVAYTKNGVLVEPSIELETPIFTTVLDLGVIGNILQPVLEEGIRITEEVLDAVVQENQILVYGLDDAAILLEAGTSGEPTRALVDGNMCTLEVGQICIHLDGTTDTQLSGHSIAGGEGIAFKVERDLRSVVTDNIIVDTAHGIWVSDATGTEVSQNTIVNGGTAISAIDTDLTGFLANEIVGPTGPAMSFLDDQSAWVEANEITGGGEPPIQYRGDGGMFLGNTVSSAVRSMQLGYVFDPGSADRTLVSIEENTFSGSGSAVGVGFEVLSVTFANNAFVNNGVSIDAADAADLTGYVGITDNTFTTGVMQAIFRAEVPASRNLWSDISSLEIFDTDADGLGDCGIDYPYGSVSGRVLNVVDTSPVTGKVASPPEVTLHRTPADSTVPTCAVPLGPVALIFSVADGGTGIGLCTVEHLGSGSVYPVELDALGVADLSGLLVGCGTHEMEIRCDPPVAAAHVGCGVTVAVPPFTVGL